MSCTTIPSPSHFTESFVSANFLPNDERLLRSPRFETTMSTGQGSEDDDDELHATFVAVDSSQLPEPATLIEMVSS